ncbi:sensor domain-containing diguanylate cyclase [Paenibacillus sabinae]|uniref:PAS sensor protein n=1 Tax=Paenibacillus sabinae T27 TaxID=1268072 RepID=X4ZTH5_9BACL|nr:diguanylate cyclase [Paenibacillus sabinae]AHV95169.1 PAS sensor protein [Paenibacillus sabinae T27]
MNQIIKTLSDAATIRIRRAGRPALGLILLLLLLLPLSPTVNSARLEEAPDTVSLRTNTDLQDDLKIYEDKGGLLTIEDMVNPNMDVLFVPYPASGLGGSIRSSTYWVKLNLYNTSSKARDLLLELGKPQLSRVNLYQLDDERHFLRLTRAGSSLPFNERAIDHRNFIFNLSFPAGSGQRLYFQIQTGTDLQLPMKLWETRSFLERELRENLMFGIYYGIMLVMAVYNSFLYITNRDRTYLYYVLFLVSFAVMQAAWDGYAYQFLWPGHSIWEQKSVPVSMVLACLFGCLFSHSFLPVSRLWPRMGRIVPVFTAGLIVTLPLMAFMAPGACIKLAACLASASMLLCAIRTAAAGLPVRSVWFYTLAWIVLSGSSLLILLAAYQLIPLNVLSLNSMRFGLGAGTLLLSLALAERFNRIRQKKRLEEKQGALLKNLHDTTKKLTSTYDVDKLLQYTLSSLSEITGCENGFILLRTDESYSLKAEIGSGPGDAMVIMELEDDSFFRSLLREKRVAVREGGAGFPGKLGQGAETCMGIPILFQDRVHALVVLYSRFTRTFIDSEREILGDFAGQVGISIENARLFSEINRMATTDGLTGVYNRTYFLKLAKRHLSQSWSLDKPLSLIMVDIDYFKSINDRCGHLAGDKVIQETARRLTELSQPRGIIGRFGGEEFMILLPGIAADRASGLAEIMRKSISSSPVPLEDSGSIRYTISLGVAEASPDTNGITMLIDQADQALYRAKKEGRNCVKEYDTMGHFA